MTRWTLLLLASLVTATLTALSVGPDAELVSSLAGGFVLLSTAVWYWSLEVREQPEAMPKLRLAGLAVLGLLMTLLYSLLVLALSLPETVSRVLLTLLLSIAGASTVTALAAALDLALLNRLRWSRAVAVVVIAGTSLAVTAAAAWADAGAGTVATMAAGSATLYPLVFGTALLALAAPMEWVVSLDRRQRGTVLAGWAAALVPLSVAIYAGRLIPLPHQHLLQDAIHRGSVLCVVFVILMLARATLALPGARAYERKARELDAVYDFGLTAGFAFNPAELRSAALDSMQSVVESEVSLFIEPETTGTGWLCVLSRADAGGRHVYRYRARTPWAGLAERFADRRPVVVVDHRKAPPGVLERIWEPATGSSVIVPVIGENARLSAVLIVGRFARHAFNTAEVRSLAGFATQVALAMDHARLLRDTVEAERRKKELEIARELQMNLLPKEPPPIPGLDIADRSEPASEVGGDYFDYLMLENGRFGVVVGDVAGHGMPAGLLMAMAKSAIHTQVQVGGSPAALMGRLSETLLRMSADNQFMTMVFAEFDLAAGEYRYSNAGHHYPLHYRAGTGAVEQLESTGVPLGLLPRPPGPFERRDIGPGDILVFYSDGVVEAERADEEMFGMDRLRDVVLANRRQSSETIVEAIFTAVRRFVGDRPLHDDATLVIVRVDDAASAG